MHAEKVLSLNNQVYDTGSSALAKLNDYVDKHAGGTNNQSMSLLDENSRMQNQTQAVQLELKKANNSLAELGEINRQ